MPAAYMAWEFAGMGWGRYTPAEYVTDWKAGDIMSAKGHVWMSLGMCEDGSVLLLHASPPGVSLCGTAEMPRLHTTGLSGVKDKSGSQAELLAEQYMRKYYPKWYERYPNCSRDVAYLKKSSQMRWNRGTLSDVEKLTEKTASEVLAWLFDEKK